jgi:hypothetical protein
MELGELKARWGEVLDSLLERDRILWLAFFDARLVSLEKGVLTLDFDDVTKLAGAHDYRSIRKPEHMAILGEVIEKITGESVRIIEV